MLDLILNLIIGVLSGVTAGILVNKHRDMKERTESIKKEQWRIKRELKRFHIKIAEAALYNEDSNDDRRAKEVLLDRPTFLNFREEELAKDNKKFVDSVHEVMERYNKIHKEHFKHLADVNNYLELLYKNLEGEENTIQLGVDHLLIKSYIMEAANKIDEIPDPYENKQ